MEPAFTFLYRYRRGSSLHWEALRLIHTRALSPPLLLAHLVILIPTDSPIEHTQHRASHAMTARPPAPRSTTSGSQVRRNLFHHHLSRRPTSASTSTSTTTLQESAPDDSAEIVPKDQNGNYQISIPRLPPLDEDQPPEDEGSEKESQDEPIDLPNVAGVPD